MRPDLEAQEQLWRAAMMELVQGAPPWLTVATVIGSEHHKLIELHINGGGNHVVALLQQAAEQIEEAIEASLAQTEGTA